MLIVDTYLKPSEGKGIGLFAKTDISKGMTWWIRNELFDKVITLAEIDTMNVLAASFIKTYGFLEPAGNWYLCIDNARFSNHSDSANTYNHITKNGKLVYCTATIDIKAGEEILCNYRELCLTCVSGVGFDIHE